MHEDRTTLPLEELVGKTVENVEVVQYAGGGRYIRATFGDGATLYADDPEAYHTPSFDANVAARLAVEVLTSGDLGPSTRDLLTLEGIAAGAADWCEDEERASHVNTILGEYEFIAEDDVAQKIAMLRTKVNLLYRDSAWGR